MCILLFAAGAGAATVMRQAGLAWAEGAGGTSGALWGRALEAVGAALSDETAADAATVIAAVAAGAESVPANGGAQPGDKTGDNIDTVEIKTAVGAGQRRRADLEHDTRPIVQARRPGTRRPHAPSSSDQPAASVQMPSAASSRSS